MIGQKNLLLLEYLTKHKNKTATEISDALQLDPAIISSYCRSMVSKELLTRTLNHNDTWIYSITHIGRKYLSLKQQLKALLHEQE